MQWVHLTPVCGLKWIDVDWTVIINRRGVRHMTQSVHLMQLYVEMVTFGPWSADVSRDLLDM